MWHHAHRMKPSRRQVPTMIPIGTDGSAASGDAGSTGEGAGSTGPPDAIGGGCPSSDETTLLASSRGVPRGGGMVLSTGERGDPAAREQTAGRDRAQPGQRLAAVDTFRGFAIASMLLVNCFSLFAATPGWLRHASGEGIRFADTVAPLFLFALAVVYRLSLRRRVQTSGTLRAHLGMVRRYLLLVLIGLAGGLVARMEVTFDWGVLQAIGLAGLVALPFMRLSPGWRILGAAALLGAHGLAASHYLAAGVDSSHGGPVGSLAWAALVLVASCAGEILERGHPDARDRALVGYGALLLASGIALAAIDPLDRHQLSASYVVVTAGISALVLEVFLLADRHRLTLTTLRTLGTNPLLVFVVHYPLIRVARAVLGVDAALGWVVAAFLCVYALCWAMCRVLDRRGVYLRA